MLKSPAFGSLPLVAVLIGFGTGCGGGCSGFRPLPADPAPYGLPRTQVIEGGIQTRITKPGVDKLIGILKTQIKDALSGGFCILDEQGISGLVGICDRNDCPGNQPGCPAFIYLDSKDRPSSTQPSPPFPPAAANVQDMLDGISLTFNNSSPGVPPSLTADVAFDALVPLHGYLLFGVLQCYAYAYNDHLNVSTMPPADPIHLRVKLDLTVNPTTGKLELHVPFGGFQILNLGLNVSGCSGVGTVLNAIVSFVSDTLESDLGNFVIALLSPIIDDFIQNILPDPLGLAGVLDTGEMLSSFQAPKEAGLETYLVPGGYVSSSNGGLTLGVMSGSNSDRDPATRTTGQDSEPSLCVPARDVPALGQAPWNLPPQVTRGTFTLLPAGPFSGSPEPTTTAGGLRDVAIGVSRTYLDLIGFHLINSGSLCLTIGGSLLAQLNAGTLGVLVPSLGNVLEDARAPLFLSLRPTQPILFTIGEGTAQDSLVHIGITDLRIDFYAWIEERYVRLMTVALDLNIGANLTSTTTADGKAALQPMLSGIDAANIKIRVSNTDLLQETPTALEGVFPMLISIATNALMGQIAPIALPELLGFRLDDLEISRVQTSQDDFLGIFATIAEGAPFKLGPLETQATLTEVNVPTLDKLRALEHPIVKIDLAAQNSGARPVEYAWRINGGAWHQWTTSTKLELADDAFMLQGRHAIDIRARAIGDLHSEDKTPARVDVLIDSMPPTLAPTLDGDRLSFGAFDIVSETAQLRYSYKGADNVMASFTAVDALTLSEVTSLTNGGKSTLEIFARDEAGNIGSVVVDPSKLSGFHGRTTSPSTSSGCGCDLGGAQSGTDMGARSLALLGLTLLVMLRRRASRAPGALLGVGLSLALLASGCGCESNVQCSVNDDCAKLSCDVGQIPQCQVNMCICTPDLSMGDVGRFASMTLIGDQGYVAAYNQTWGDLMIGHITPPGIVNNWEFVDGVPNDPPDVIGAHVRGGISGKGDDVGRYTSIQVAKNGEPVVAYYDRTNASLKFASFGAIRWRNHIVDRATGAPDGEGDDIGRWASMSIGSDGRPGIAYSAIIAVGKSGKREGQLRWAEAMVENPTQPSDWKITVLDSRALEDSGAPVPDGGAPDMSTGAPDGGAEYPLFPDGIALMPSVARRSTGSPAIAYYDRRRGNLRYVEFDDATSQWKTPVVLDGETLVGADTGDVGLYPSLTFDGNSVGHISYVDASRDNLLYVNTETLTPEVVDDGYRAMDEVTLDGLPAPVFHLVGDSSSIQTASNIVVVAYQDSTALQLRVAKRTPDGTWTHESIAGHATPFMGSYGFYAGLRIAGRLGIISTYAINQQRDLPEFYVELFAVDLMLVQ